MEYWNNGFNGDCWGGYEPEEDDEGYNLNGKRWIDEMKDEEES